MPNHEAVEPALQPLSAMRRHRVAKGESDIREWDVVAADHKRVGTVHDLIVDCAAMKVRYLDVEVEGKHVGASETSHFLMPIAEATLDADDERVYLDAVTSVQLASIPPYDHRLITPEFEQVLMRHLHPPPVEPVVAPPESPQLPVRRDSKWGGNDEVQYLKIDERELSPEN